MKEISLKFYSSFENKKIPCETPLLIITDTYDYPPCYFIGNRPEDENYVNLYSGDISVPAKAYIKEELFEWAELPLDCEEIANAKISD